MTPTRDPRAATDSVGPYLERVMADERLQHELLGAFTAARRLAGELAAGPARPITLVNRVATDEDIRNKLREALEDLRRAGERLQGKRERSARGPAILTAAIALGVLFNPLTGAETRRFIRDLLAGGGNSAGEPAGDTPTAE